MDTIQPGEDQHSRFRALLTAVFNRNTIFQEYSWHGQSSLRQKTNHSLKQTLPAQYIVGNFHHFSFIVEYTVYTYCAIQLF